MIILDCDWLQVKAYHAQAPQGEVEEILAEGPPQPEEHQDVSTQMWVRDSVVKYFYRPLQLHLLRDGDVGHAEGAQGGVHVCGPVRAGALRLLQAGQLPRHRQVQLQVSSASASLFQLVLANVSNC